MAIPVEAESFSPGASINEVYTQSVAILGSLSVASVVLPNVLFFWKKEGLVSVSPICIVPGKVVVVLLGIDPTVLNTVD